MQWYDWPEPQSCQIIIYHVSGGSELTTIQSDLKVGRATIMASQAPRPQQPAANDFSAHSMELFSPLM